MPFDDDLDRLVALGISVKSEIAGAHDEGAKGWGPIVFDYRVGAHVVLWTVDNTNGRNKGTYRRTRPKDLSQCVSCHGPGEPPGGLDTRDVQGDRDDRRPCAEPGHGLGVCRSAEEILARTLVIKGITHEDARLALEHGFDAILLSNYGGRATETLRSTLEALPEVVAEVGNRIPVFVDGGFRRGTDIFKALAFGARAVGVGRPFLWGLGAFGQAGVDRVLEILQGELKLAMGNCGTRTVADINRTYVATPDWKRS